MGFATLWSDSPLDKAGDLNFDSGGSPEEAYIVLKVLLQLLLSTNFVGPALPFEDFLSGSDISDRFAKEGKDKFGSYIKSCCII